MEWQPDEILASIVEQPIVSYHRDEESHWVAELACGHFQHVRHTPPWMVRPWVLTEEGRESMLGFRLECKKCDQGVPEDRHPQNTPAP